MVALAASLVLSVISWRSMTGGQRIKVSNGLSRGFVSRSELVVVPPLMIGAIGLGFFVWMGPAADFASGFVGIWILGVLVFQCIMIGIAQRTRRDRRQRRDGLFGE